MEFLDSRFLRSDELPFCDLSEEGDCETEKKNMSPQDMNAPQLPFCHKKFDCSDITLLKTDFIVLKTECSSFVTLFSIIPL